MSSNAEKLYKLIAKELGAKRAVKLDVSGPFHSQLMLKARDEFSGHLDKVTFKSEILDNVGVKKWMINIHPLL